MSNDISSVLPQHMSAAGSSLRSQAARPGQTEGSMSRPTVEIKVPQRAELHVNPEESRRNLQDAIRRMNDQMQSRAQNLNFRIDEASNRFVITVKNTLTGEVVRQIPDEVVLKVAHNIEELKGVLHNAVV